MNCYKTQKGAALIICMIFLCIFSTLAASMATMSGTNVQLADNQRKADSTRACAESGLEITRYWLSQVAIPGDTAPSNRFNLIANSFLSATSGISNITPTYDGSTTITIPSVTLDSESQKSFSATITSIDDETLQADITGTYGQLTRTIRVNYTFGYRTHTVFDYGMATKGPLSLAGNIELSGVNISVESNVFIESENSNLALSIIGNSQIGGDVSISNPLATVDLQGGQAGIGGETGQEAIDNHVSIGDSPPEFPAPNPNYFEHYALNTVDSSTNTSADATFENITIAAGTNPTFSGSVTLNGIVFVETPNVVTFTGDTTITGIIVGDGDTQDNSGTNQINLLGSVVSYPVSELPDETQFTELRNELNTFIMAPGFDLSFGGNFNTLNGAIAGNGINFFGNAGGTINGTVINYSDETMELSGNSDLVFNRSGTTEIPGYVPEIVLHYNPESYSEIVL